MSSYWLGHALKRPRWRPQRQAIALATLAMFIGIIIGALYLAQAASTSTLGRQLEELITVRSQLEQENERLRGEIASLQSVPRLLARAQELGFALARRSDIEYLTVQGYNPQRSHVVPAREQEPRDLPIYDETFTGWLQQQWDNLSGQFQMFTSRGVEQ
jgi:cell division protein FtsL